MTKYTSIFFSLFIGILLISPLVPAHHDDDEGYLTCKNFTSMKKDDCKYLLKAGYSDAEEQTLLWNLYDNDYSYRGELWQPLAYDKVDLALLTDANTYQTGEEIKVTIYPQNIWVTLTYGEESITAKNEAVFLANPLTNRITASYGSETYERTINVIETSRFVLASKIICFGVFNYIIFSLSKLTAIAKWLSVA